MMESSSSEGTSAIVFWAALLLTIDALVYGIILPITGAVLGSTISERLGLSSFNEILLVSTTVNLLFCGTFYLNLENRFWKHLFSNDKRYRWILMIRDFLNVYLLASFMYLLFQSIEGISTNGTKHSNLGEGIGFVIWNGLQELRFPVPSCLLEQYTWTPPPSRSFWSLWRIDESISERNMMQNKMVVWAKLLLAIAGITGAVTKAIYFNTLETYMRAMKVFMGLQDSSPPQSRTSASNVAEKDAVGGMRSMESFVSNYISDFSFNAKEFQHEHEKLSPTKQRHHPAMIKRGLD